MRRSLRRLVVAGALACLLLASALFFSSRSQTEALHLATAAPGSVVINEVAWMGTEFSTHHEWMELYNVTREEIDLTGWTLSAVTGTLNIPLAGTIPAHGYFLLERTSDDPISDIPADWVGPFGTGLLNAGDSLYLRDGTNQVIDTANADGGTWPAGDNTSKSTMERIDPWAPDTDDNWATNDGVTRNGHDADGNPINGTPKAPNSAYQPDLVVAKSGPLTAEVGSLITYHLLVTNTGPLTATDTHLTDTLPVDFVPVATSHPTLTQQGPTLVWAIGELGNGAGREITLTVQLPQVAGDYVNAITASTTVTESWLDNNSASHILSVHEKPVPSADLVVAKSGPLTAEVGSLITYRLLVTNTGSLTATDTHLTDTLPVDFVPVATSHPTLTQQGPILVWLLGDLESGSAQALTLTVQLPQERGGSFVNLITATTTTTEPVTHNNSSSHTVDVGAPWILINAALYAGYPTSGGPGEAIQLVNAGTQAALLEGWEICKYATPLNCKSLPTIDLPAGAFAWLADKPANFESFFGFAAHYTATTWIGMTDSGGELILRDPRDPTGLWVDVLVYNAGQTSINGWSGPSVTDYGIGLDSKYQILARIPDERTGLPSADTDSAADWMQDLDNPQRGRRALYPGWDYVESPTTPLFWPLKATEPATVVVGIAPDNAFQVISSTLMQATRAISIEVYSLRHPAIVDILETKAGEGVSVTVLLEGSPAGIATEDWEQELNACKLIETAGGRCYFMISNSDSSDRRFNRYSYLHSKLIIVDDRWVMVGTQNLTNSSLPADDKSNGTAGSRGVVIATTAPSVVQRAQEIFAMDCDSVNHRDILRWNTGGDDYAKWGQPLLDYDPAIPDGISDTVRFPSALIVTGTLDFELFTAPEATLRRSDALLGLLARAGSGDRVYVEQLNEPPAWNHDPLTEPNLRLEAYIDAARRGAGVRILVDSTSYTATHRNTYTRTVVYVNDIAAAEGLDLKAAGGSPLTYGIHNKMVLVWLDGEGGYAHVGSINGSERSNKANREVALQIQSDAVFEYLERMFMVDWHLSNPVYLPLVLRNYEPPVQHVVISEVYYKYYRDGEWVEIYNPTGRAIDLSNYKLGDAERPDSFEGMVKFPAGTTIPGQGVLVIAYNGNSVPDADFEFYDFNPAIPEMEPYPGWGDPRYDWGLRDGGDQVLLLGPDNVPVDVVVWGDAAYPGVVPHPGTDNNTHSLQRYPPNYDTNDCAFDFRSFPTTLGEVLFP
ncbi:MAG: lamin tail domain-containing protein [Anaerolineales bacterium]